MIRRFSKGRDRNLLYPRTCPTWSSKALMRRSKSSLRAVRGCYLHATCNADEMQIARAFQRRASRKTSRCRSYSHTSTLSPGNCAR
eukprot:5882848-Pleurochrysis_carterae.AAC.1